MTRNLMLIPFVLLASAAHAQDAGFFAKLSPGAPVVDRPGCAWQWSQQSHVAPGWGGWYQQCSVPTPAPPPQAAPAPAPVDACDGPFNPYVVGGNPELAARCIDRRLLSLPPAVAKVYRVGARYEAAYPGERMVVLAVALALDGRAVVLAQWLTRNDHVGHMPGDVFTFRPDDNGYEWQEAR